MKLKFLQKKQVALIALTFVVMLAVWFVKSPLRQKDKEEPTNEVNFEISIFEDLRDAVLEQRADEVASWDKILSDENSTLASKQMALAQKNAISDLTEKEVLLEVEVINMGYEDAFVHCTDAGVEVYIKADEESATSAVEIIQLVYSHFDDATNVIVNFKNE
jgi:hypothetical protein